MLYQIITGNDQSYVSKRAIVDYKNDDYDIVIVDWSKVTSDFDISTIEKHSVTGNTVKSVLSEFPTLYPDNVDLSAVSIKKHTVSNQNEYQIVYQTDSEIVARVLYKYKTNIILLAE